MKNPFKLKLRLVKGTRFVSFLFIGCSILIAAGILIAANMYYNIDTGEIVMEEIQRTTGLIRAIGGVIIGGTSTSTLPAGVAFQVATTSDVLLSGADQVLRFSGGTSFYTGFKATTTLTTTTVYAWPGTYPVATGRVLQSTTDGELSWLDLGAAGLGDILAVGDVSSGEAFTSGTASGTSLWFHDSGFKGELTIGTLTANATYTLPDLTGTIALQNSGSLGTGGVLFADSGLIATSTNFYWDNASRYLQIGSSATDGQLRIYSSHANGYYLGLAATSTMTASTTYYWPVDYGTNNYVLTTDGAGQLQWTPATGTGAVIGTGADGRVTYWTGASTVDSDADFTWNAGTNMLTLGGGLVASLIQSTGALTFQAQGGNIILDPSTYIVQLATSTYIRTNEGYEIGRAGTQVLREMIPILGFDLPVQTATTSYVKISKTLENYPFQGAATGTTRVHKLVFRYAASTTAADEIAWRVSTTTGQTYSSSTLTHPTSDDLEKGNAYVVTTTIPTDDTDWWLDIKTGAVSDTVRVFQIFLAAYDQID